jgi:hypothetical protein
MATCEAGQGREAGAASRASCSGPATARPVARAWQRPALQAARGSAAGVSLPGWCLQVLPAFNMQPSWCCRQAKRQAMHRNNNPNAHESAGQRAIDSALQHLQTS